MVDLILSHMSGLMVSLKIESTIPATTTTHTTLITFHKLLRCLVSLFFVYVVFVVEADIEKLLSVIFFVFVLDIDIL